MYLLIGKPMLPYGRGWSVFLLWVCAHIGGFLAAQVMRPSLKLIVEMLYVCLPRAAWSQGAGFGELCAGCM